MKESSLVGIEVKEAIIKYLKSVRFEHTKVKDILVHVKFSRLTIEKALVALEMENKIEPVPVGTALLFRVIE